MSIKCPYHLGMCAPGVDAPQEVLHTFICEHEVKLGADGKEFVLYGARVHIMCASGNHTEWWIFRRYSDWLALHGVLSKQTGGGTCPKPPPKRIWNTDANVVAKRKVELNRWLAEVVSERDLARSPELIAWLRMGDLQVSKGRLRAPLRWPIDFHRQSLTVLRPEARPRACAGFDGEHGGRCVPHNMDYHPTRLP